MRGEEATREIPVLTKGKNHQEILSDSYLQEKVKLSLYYLK